MRSLLLSLILLLARVGAAAEAHPLDRILADKALLEAPMTYPAEGFTSADPRVKALFFDAKPYRGKPTRAFAWMGVPKVEPGKKMPGMVLVHGGGGTAFDKWVSLWVSRGYAAIAMDTCGQVPRGSYGKWEHHANAGPLGWDNTFKQVSAGEADEDNWTYHAVCDAMLAHSLLRAQEGVDPERTGLTGISWGGYLTCYIAGADPRFKLAVPVYGCGFIDECTWAPTLQKMPPEKRDEWIAKWDPRHGLKRADMPMLWVTGTNDFAYHFPALRKSYRLPTGPRTLCVRLRMPHGHNGPGENPAEILAFADSVLRGGPAPAKVTGQGREANGDGPGGAGGGAAWATFQSAVPVSKAELLYTKDTGAWPKRTWQAVPAAVKEGRVTATLPEGTTVYYLNLVDEKGHVVSTEHEEVR